MIFTQVSRADYKIHNKKAFLEMIGKPGPFTDLQAQDIFIRILPGGEFALVHGG